MFTVIPYELTGAAQTGERELEVLKDCQDCIDNYMDDYVASSDDMKSHVKKSWVFNTSSSGVTSSKDKVDVIVNWPTPKSTKEVRSFWVYKLLLTFYPKVC